MVSMPPKEVGQWRDHRSWGKRSTNGCCCKGYAHGGVVRGNARGGHDEVGCPRGLL